MANHQGSKINDTWAKAMASYKRELNEKQYQMVKALTCPQDIIVHMKQLEKDHTSSSSGKFIDRVKGVTDCLVRFSTIVDTMTSSSMEASLIWGSLKVLLTIAHQSSEMYKKICESFMVVGESFQIVGLLADTFAQSDLVSDCIVRYYCSILRFWRKTLKHFRRNKIINLFRSPWYNYDREFGNFEREIKRLRDESQQASNAVYMNEGKQAREQQNEQHKSFSYEIRNAEEKKQHRELVKWLPLLLEMQNIMWKISNPPAKAIILAHVNGFSKNQSFNNGWTRMVQIHKPAFCGFLQLLGRVRR